MLGMQFNPAISLPLNVDFMSHMSSQFMWWNKLAELDKFEYNAEKTWYFVQFVDELSIYDLLTWSLVQRSWGRGGGGGVREPEWL